MTLMGGYLFMSTLLGISDVVTTELTQTSFSLAAFAHVEVAASTSGLGNDVLALLYPLSLVVIAGFLVAAVVGWIMREVDLIVYVGLMQTSGQQAACALRGTLLNFDDVVLEALVQVTTTTDCLATARTVSREIYERPGDGEAIRVSWPYVDSRRGAMR